jgi:ornithine decarboxylase
MAPAAILEYQELTNKFHKEASLLDDHHGGDQIITNGLASKALVQSVLKEHISGIDTNTCDPGDEDAFYVADMGEVYRQHLRWKLNLARVKPFYGKCTDFSPDVSNGFHVRHIFAIRDSG